MEWKMIFPFNCADTSGDVGLWMLDVIKNYFFLPASSIQQRASARIKQVDIYAANSSVRGGGSLGDRR